MSGIESEKAQSIINGERRCLQEINIHVKNADKLEEC